MVEIYEMEFDNWINAVDDRLDDLHKKVLEAKENGEINDEDIKEIAELFHNYGNYTESATMRCESVLEDIKEIEFRCVKHKNHTGYHIWRSKEVSEEVEKDYEIYWVDNND